MKNSNKLKVKISYYIFATCIVAFFFCVNTQDTFAAGGNPEKYDSAFVANHSAMKATLYSAVLPGLGQIYNRKAWKAPIIYGLLITNIYLNLYYTEQFNIYKAGIADFDLEIINEDLKRIQPILLNNYEFGSGNDETTKSRLENRRDEHQRSMHITILAFGGIYLLNVLDANIDAEFLEYDISKDLTVKLRPSIFKNSFSQRNNVGLTCSLRF